IDDAHRRLLAEQLQQVVERLLAFALELVVLPRVTRVNHQLHQVASPKSRVPSQSQVPSPKSVPSPESSPQAPTRPNHPNGNLSGSTSSCSPHKLWTLTPS